jgi:hypothetical protein
VRRHPAAAVRARPDGCDRTNLAQLRVAFPPDSAEPPLETWQVNVGWVIAANIAADLTVWTRLLGHRDANPDTLRYRIWHLPARHARERILKISPDWR